MSDIMRHMPFDVPEPFRRFLQGDVGSWLRVEEFEEGSAMVIRAELPGIDPDRDVDISVSGDRLTIDAKREEKSEHKDKASYRSEFRYGSFSRSFQLPHGVKEDDIAASYHDGVLEVRVPTAAESASTTKKVRVNRTAGAGGTGSASGTGTGGSAGGSAGMPGTPPPTFPDDDGGTAVPPSGTSF